MEKRAFNVDLEAAEKEHGMGGGGKSEFFKFHEGDNRIRVLAVPSILVSHFSRGGYIGSCIGKDNKCPGCLQDEKVRAENEKESDSKKHKKLTRNIKWLTWVVDYNAAERMKADPAKLEDEIKLAKLPHNVMKQIKAYQDNPEYAFAEAPMPYDITIKAVGAGTKEVDYSILPARANTPLAEQYATKLPTLTDPEQIIERMKAKKMKELGIVQEGAPEPVEEESSGVKYPEEEINPEDIPF